jgi:phosphoserine phosphatase RsbU/P
MARQNNKILVVDDDNVTRKVISYALNKNGYSVVEANGPTTALDILHTGEISLVFCDVMMDDMDGYEFCIKVRSIEEYKALPFIFITSKNTSEDRSKAFSIGADDFITKPFNIEELLMKTKSILRRIEIYTTYGLKKKFEDTADSPAKILIVDDDILISTLFSKALDSEGFICETANGANEGINKAKLYKPDIILSDFMMPDTDGFEFRRMLMREPLLKDIPFVFLTSNDSDTIILEGFDLDIKDYILKSTKPKIVAARIGNIIKNFRRERQTALHELQTAADSISMEVVPEAPPEFSGFVFNQWHVPYKGVPGGDFIDYIQTDENTYIVVLGDIMGKKWGAWFFAFSFIGYIRSAVRVVLKHTQSVSAGDILKKVNETIYYDSKISEIFSTLSIVVVNNRDYTIQYSGAGDLPLLMYDSATGNVKEYRSDGLLLGLSPDGGYNNIVKTMNPGDTFFIYTDGIIETTNNEDEQYGSSRFIDSIKNGGDDKFASVKKVFTGFSNGDFQDDVSLLSVKRI